MTTARGVGEKCGMCAGGGGGWRHPCAARQEVVGKNAAALPVGWPHFSPGYYFLSEPVVSHKKLCTCIYSLLGSVRLNKKKYHGSSSMEGSDSSYNEKAPFE